MGLTGTNYTQGGLGFAFDGTLYLFSNYDTYGPYTVHLGTGAASPVTTEPAGFAAAQDAFDVDPATGLGTHLGSVSVPSGVVLQTATFSPIPEPSTLLLVGWGVVALAAARRRRIGARQFF